MSDPAKTTTLQVWQEIVDAHKNSSIFTLVKTVYSRRPLLLLPLAIVGIICSLFFMPWLAHYDRYLIFRILLVCLVMLVYNFFHNRAVESEYKDVYNSFGALTTLYSSSYEFIRFSLFASQLANKKITHEQVSKATSLLELEEKTFLPFFANNALTVFLATLLLSIVAGAASIDKFWDGWYIKFGIIGILLVFYVHLMIHPFKSAPARRGELQRFLLWYRSAPESTWIRTSTSANSTS